ncbi:TauD/TfdA family dioxygenase [Thalassospiraceae bacterium LMO-SO8]|nr:TauD/TfdA family dioxygenase [Alphaproteobacteria bacterium LMO-S08]WND77971.1 TauD/TfdA family dioxygenase [Thalassospiraceae bacterium LMO-SO8]
MTHPTQPLNGDFGILIDQVTPGDLADPDFQAWARGLWLDHGGLLGVRGDALADLEPEALVRWSEVFGVIEDKIQTAREDKSVAGFPILRIGNVRDKDGKMVAQLLQVPQLTSDADIRYNPETRRPVWHTDSTFRARPPVGSVFHCRKAPPEGAETLFADMQGAYAALPPEERRKLDGLEAVCSLAHHDKKINSYSPHYPVLTPEQRKENPPNRVPLVLKHPVTGKPSLYGLNSSTCAIVPIGQDIDPADLDKWDLEGVEDDSVMIWRDMLPTVTGPEFTVKWQWRPGDIVVWDNRSTIHSGTGFDYSKYEREMWRLTLVAEARANA